MRWRAPYDAATSSFSGDDATAVTVAPSSTPSWTAARPTPPPAPRTTSSSPSPDAGDRAQHVVRGAMGHAERGGDALVDAGRDPSHCRGGDDRLLGERADEPRPRHPVTDDDVA